MCTTRELYSVSSINILQVYGVHYKSIYFVYQLPHRPNTSFVISCSGIMLVPYNECTAVKAVNSQKRTQHRRIGCALLLHATNRCRIYQMAGAAVTAFELQVLGQGWESGRAPFCRENRKKKKTPFLLLYSYSSIYDICTHLPRQLY